MKRKSFTRYLPVLFALFIVQLGVLMLTRPSVGAYSGFVQDECENVPDDGKGRSACKAAAAEHKHDNSLQIEDYQAPMNLAAINAVTTCSGGTAGSYPCNNVDLLSFTPLSSMGGGNGNDIWGWTDPQTGKEYAIMGRTNGTSFVDISDPVNPVYLGNLPSHTGTSTWRDVKTYQNHAYIVADNNGNHGVQVFDLTQLRNVTSPPVTFSNTAHYGNVGSVHNIVINEDTGFAYAVGTSSGSNRCSGGLHMINIQNPANPTFAGCYSSDGYTHDAQCVVYNGPDAQHQGKEICFNSNEDTLTIVDVSTKSNPIQLARMGYGGSEYTHQGWLTEDQRYFLLDDELDEQRNSHNTRTYVWDIQDLDNPTVIGVYSSPNAAVDHNQYIKGNYTYEANYRAGLRILSLSNVASGNLSEVAYFDIYPSSNSNQFNGAWSNYPYFDSGVVIVSGIEQGLYVLQPNLGPPPTPTPTSPPATITPTSPPTDTPEPGSCVTYNSTNVPVNMPNGTASISSNLSVGGSGTIDDVNVSVNMPHAWPGDLSFTLTHQDTGTAVQIIDRPGVPASTWGCSTDDINATLDDEAGTAVESTCAGSPPAISGSLSPNNALSAFDGENGNGTWVLTVNDAYTSGDAGSLNGWSVEICTVGVLPTPTNTSVPPTATNTSVPPTATSTSVPPTNTPTPGPGGDVFFDDFESDQGWTVNPNGTDNATTGLWERANPEQTTYSGTTYQQGTTSSGSFDLVTAGAAGSGVGSNDLDGGTTSVRSPNIVLPSSGNLTLSFDYYLAHYSNSDSSDFFRVTVVGNTSSVVLQELGAADVDGATWATHTSSLNSFAGQTVYILIEASDSGGGSLVEAGVDDVRITSN